MTASHLTSPDPKLWVDILNALTAGTFSHLTMSQAEIKQRILNNLSGGSVSYLTTGQQQMVQSILTELHADGISYSALTHSPSQVLAAVVNEIEEGGGGGDEPEAVVSLDFATGTYLVNGGSVAAAAVVSDPTKITGGGLTLEDGVDFPVEIIGDAGTVARGAWQTVVITYDTNVAATRWEGNNLFFLSDDEVAFQEQLTVLTYDSATEDDGALSRSIDMESGAPSDGTHKVAIRRTAEGLSGSSDGDAVVTDSGEFGSYTPTAAFFGGGFGDSEAQGCKVLKIEFYSEAMTDQQLIAAAT